jgi:hypothetical protein
MQNAVFRDEASVELPDAALVRRNSRDPSTPRPSSIEAIAIVAALRSRKTGVESVGGRKPRLRNAVSGTEHLIELPDAAWFDRNPRGSEGLPRLRSGFRLRAPTPARRLNFDFAPIFNRAIAIVAALRSGRQGLGVLERVRDGCAIRAWRKGAQAGVPVPQEIRRTVSGRGSQIFLLRRRDWC